MKLSELAENLDNIDEEEDSLQEGSKKGGPASVDRELVESTKESGLLGLQSKQSRVQQIREETKTGTYDPVEDEDVSPEEQPGILRMLEAAGVSQGEREVAQSFLRPPAGDFSLSKIAQKEPVIDPAFSLVEVPKAGGDFGIDDIVNFIIGDEMAVIGLQYDNNGFGWDLEVARKQWAEEPLWVNLLATTALVGTVAFPAMKAVTTSAKFGKIGSMLGKFGPREQELAKWKTLGAIDSAIPDAEVSDFTLGQIRRLEHARSKHFDFEAKKIAEMEDRLAAGMQLPSGRTVSQIEAMKWQFDKRFTNTYFEHISSISQTGQVKKEFIDNLDRLWKNEKLGRFFVDVPDNIRGQALYANLLLKSSRGLDLDAVIKKANPNITTGELKELKTGLKLNPQEQAWADNMWDAMKTHQDEALKEGFITPEMRDRVGQVHLAAFTKDTPLDAASTRRGMLTISKIPGKSDDTVLKAFDFPRLDAPQIRHRASEVGDVADRLFKGELLTDPEKLTFAGYVTDRLLLNNFKFIRDHAMKYGRSEGDVVTAFGSIANAEKKGWVSLSKLRNGVPEVESTLARMLKTANHSIKDGESLPFIHKSQFEAMFGNGGIFEQTQNVNNILHLLTAIHKTSKTVFNIPTHMNNLVGNFAFLAMAGYNPFSPKNLGMMDDVSRAFIKWANAHDKTVSMGKKAEDLYNPVTKRLRGVDLGKIKIGDKTFDMNDEFLDPMVKEIIGEESAFLHAEGLAIVQSFFNKAKKGSWERAFAGAMVKAKDINKFTSNTFDYMTKAYLGEDVVPKMAYYLDLRARGMSKEWAVLEVGRRLPVYSTVGSSIQGARKLWFPWATFPAEAARIMKNNIMDHPISTLPWLHAPGLLQAGFAATGLGPDTFEEVEERKRQLPQWAQTATTVIAGETGSRVGARMGLGVTGAGVGAALGGLPGAAVGGALGVALPPEMSAMSGIGAGAGAIATGGRGGAAIGGVLGAATGMYKVLTDERESSDQLRGAIMRWLPWSAMTPASNSPEYVWDFQGILAQLPVEPLAILRPAVDIMAGKTAFGQEIQGEGPGDTFGKMLSGTLGMLMPPYFQKYGFKITTPDQPITQLLVGGQGIPGDITNVSRFLTDTGQAIDPLSGQPGNFTFDFLMNNINGLWQSYAVKPETRLLNEARQEAALSEIRGYYGKQLSYYAQNEDWATVSEITERTFSTFARQYTADPGMAQQKFSEWMERYVKSFGKHPGLRNLSEEELMARFHLSSEHAKGTRSEARRDLMRVIDRERQIRKANPQKPKYLY